MALAAGSHIINNVLAASYQRRLPSHGDGTVFKVTKAGVESVLYSFTGGAGGNQPDAGVVFDKQGNLFGTTVNGGIANSNCLDGCGGVFELVL